jgi:FKBP-type peptidyl-prolyl cis-trans isomerase SlyD
MIKKVMNIAKDQVVSINYTLTDVNGQVLDSSQETGPLSYLHGNDNIIPGLEKALEGKTEGATLKVSVPAAEAYGLRDEQLVINVPKSQFQDAGTVEEGMQFEAETSDGSRIVTVTKVEGDMVTIDANHPLAGMDLNFDVQVVGIRAATEEELEHGHVHDHGHHHDDEDEE